MSYYTYRGATEDPLFAIEEAMVALRRRQTRRTLARSMSGGELPERGALFGVLDLLEAEQRAGRDSTVGGVAEGLGVDQPRASRLVADAVKRGLTRRRADQDDGRRTPLVLTSAGADVVEQVHRARRAAFAAAMTDWSAADREQFARLLSRFLDGLDRDALPLRAHE